jgi:hypothetical protein
MPKMQIMPKKQNMAKQNMVQSVLSAMVRKDIGSFMPGGKQYSILPARVSPALKKENEEKANMQKGKSNRKVKD